MNEQAMQSARERTPGEGRPSGAAIRDMLTDSDAAVRRDATLALVDRAGDGLDDETAAALARRVRDDEDPDVRQFAVEALGAAGGPVEAIGDALDDENPWVRAEVVVALSRTGADVDAALRDATDDENGWVRRNAIIALCKREAASHELLLDHLKHDGHPPAREFAAGYLPTFAADEREAVDVLAAVLARDPNAFVRAKAARSLGELGTDRAEEALETQGLPDRSDDVQRAAKRALAAARGEDPDAVDMDRGPPGGGGPRGPPDAAGGPAGCGSGSGTGSVAPRGSGDDGPGFRSGKRRSSRRHEPGSD